MQSSDGMLTGVERELLDQGGTCRPDPGKLKHNNPLRAMPAQHMHAVCNGSVLLTTCVQKATRLQKLHKRHVKVKSPEVWLPLPASQPRGGG
jgi:hypothetical protein